MNFWEIITQNWDYLDLIKIICSLVAGIVLGSEREWKDKSAGFKTIATICLGSTLFTILSYKIGAGPQEDATRIASYVVSGIGFLGAGVIFKDKYNVQGLTTASIIWISAAIGMAIGFGEFMIAFAFLISCLVIISFGSFINKKIFGRRAVKILSIHIDNDAALLQTILSDLRPLTIYAEVKRYHRIEDKMNVNIDITIKQPQLEPLVQYLISHKKVYEFTL